MYSSELSDLGIELKGKTSGRWKTKCPKCSDSHKNSRRKDLQVDVDNGIYKCWSEACQWKGTVVHSTKYSRPVFNNKTKLPDYIVKYFQGRNISQKTLNSLKITEEKGLIQFNYFRNDQLINIKSRSLDKSKMFQHKDSQKIPYNIDSLKGKTKCIFVEGEIDVLSFIEAGLSDEYGIISLDQGAGNEGSKLDGKLLCINSCAEELDSVEEFFIAFDDDAPGQWTLKEVARRLGEYRCKRVLYKGRKDANELLCDKAMNKEAAAETLRNCIKEANFIPIEGVQTLDDDYQKELLRQYDEGRTKGLEAGIEKLDSHIRFAKDEFTVVTGFAGTGKGTFTKFVALKMCINHGWKFAAYAPEDFPATEYFEDLCHMYIGKTLDKDKPNRATREEFIEAMHYIKQHFFLVYPEPDKKTGRTSLPSLDWIFEKFKYLKLAMGVNACVVDPWNKIYHNLGRNTIDMYLAEALSTVKFYAKGWDHVFLIAHQKSPQTSQKKVKPRMYTISGGAMWPNMSDNIISVDRANKTDDKDTSTTIYIEKIKKMKVNGKLGSIDLYFNKQSNRYNSSVVDYELPANHDGMMKSIEDELLDLPF